MTAFELHPQLEKDTAPVTVLGLCRVLLAKDATYPWVILVPERMGIREMHELPDPDQQTLMREITHVSRAAQGLFKADKMNVAALGNMVPQLHVHVIARYVGDAAWPGPIWGKVPARPYDTETIDARLMQIRESLNKL